MAGFTHLHVHTEYSLLDGSGKIPEMVRKAKELGFDSLAITDHGVMYGVIDFYKAARSEGIKPVIGCEVYVAPGSRFDKEASEKDSRYNHLILLAENNTGYANLMKIVSIGFLDGFYHKPRVDYEVLEKYHEGIIALSACLAGEVQRELVKNNYEGGKKAALHLEKVFGKGNFFLELQNHGMPQQQTVNSNLIKMSAETGIDLVCTNDVHYIKASDAEAHDILLCIQTQKTIHDKERMRYEGGQFYLKSEEEMRALFGHVPQALANTKMIADRCNVEIEFGVTKLPRFDYPAGYDSSWEYLQDLCREGLEKRYRLLEREDAEYLRKRMDYELSVIHDMGYVDYFLIVWDYIRFAKDKGIAVGPGRGSAAGSIVAYCLEITDIDPVKYSLVFERFLNPERVSMPDIDVDFCYERRQEVIDYVIEKYGHECVSQIITFGTLAARQAIKDVGRALEMPYNEVNEIAKLVPQAIGMTIERALEENPDFKAVYDGNPEARKIIDTAISLEGLPRHSSVHAAGVLICDRPVDEYVPVSVGAAGESVASFTMTTLENLGLLKMDFLGLRTLTVIRDAEEMIRRNNPGFSVEDQPEDDKAVYEYISTGKCDGMFQLESTGMKSFMKELKPDSLEDLIAGISLYRPGPMDFIPQYIKGKNNAANVTYECPQLEPILKPTYGCIVYQEQVMQIVRDLAGYSWGRSDLVRRAMSKKKADVMEKERHNFIYGNEEEGVDGCVKRGIPENVAGRIYDEMTDFAKYAFNKSHAACYAVIAYRTAFLKTYFPVEFMAALMTSVIDNTDKVSAYIYSCRQMGIKLLPPDINRSGESFSVEDGCVRFALSAVKGLGHAVMGELVRERDTGGDFVSMEDFVRRMCGALNKKNLENLILAGALDGIEEKTRRGMVICSTEMLEKMVKRNKDMISGQVSIFDLMSSEKNDGDERANVFPGSTVPDIEEFSKAERLEKEKDVLGIYVSGHPLDEDMNLWKSRTDAVSKDFEAESEGGECKVTDGKKYNVGGIITKVIDNVTKKGQAMAFVTIEDIMGTLETVVFPNVYEQSRHNLVEGKKIFISGKASVDASGDAKLLADKIVSFDAVPKKLWIRFPDEAAYMSAKESLKQKLAQEELSDEGSDNVIIYCTNEKKMDKWGIEERTKVTPRMLEDLKMMYGDANVEVT